MKVGFIKFLALLLLCSVLGSTAQAATQPGVVLSFDDTYVDQWYDFFAHRTDVKATFFVSYWHTLTPAQIDKLRQLEAKGNEIGAHSYSHVGVGDATFNFDPALTEKYVDEQVLPALANMLLDGFNPLSFSYPSGERDENYDAAIRPYFPFLRSTFADEQKRLYQLDDIFHDENKQYGFLSGDGIDNSYNNDLTEIEEALLRAK
ncbi:MAG: polysaccharide deacetylase family protein, partial [Thiothrix sp.]|nr:polysaccharide deacetylase family protein [Thiothrix sp.]